MRKLLPLLALALALPLASCDSTSPEASIAGLYVLESINGEGLPWVAIGDPTGTTEVTDGSIELLEDGSFRDRIGYRFVENGVTSVDEELYTGTFVKIATGARLTSPAIAPYEVSIDGDAMIQMIGETELKYKK
jgi:hypothetical protein